MKQILIALILGLCLIKAVSLVKSADEINRYKVIMNEPAGGDLIVIKYDSFTGRTWRLGFPSNQWIELQDYRRAPLAPAASDNREKLRN